MLLPVLNYVKMLLFYNFLDCQHALSRTHTVCQVSVTSLKRDISDLNGTNNMELKNFFTPECCTQISVLWEYCPLTCLKLNIYSWGKPSSFISNQDNLYCFYITSLQHDLQQSSRCTLTNVHESLAGASLLHPGKEWPIATQLLDPNVASWDSRNFTSHDTINVFMTWAMTTWNV